MSQTETLEALFAACLQDLRDGELLTTERAPAINETTSDARLDALLTRNLAASAEQAKRIEVIGKALRIETEGPDNIWMSGILDDAARDSEAIAPGALLDIALIGAFRKAKQSEIVSYATAILVAKALGYADAAADLEVTREEECAIDLELQSLQTVLTATTHRGAKNRSANSDY